MVIIIILSFLSHLLARILYEEELAVIDYLVTLSHGLYNKGKLNAWIFSQTPALPLAELVDMKPLPGSQPFPAVRSACPLPGLCLPCSLASCLPCSLASCLPPRHHTLFKACSSCRSEGKSLPSGNHGLVLIWGAVNFSEPQFLLHEMGITVPFLRVLVGCWEEAMRELPGTGWMQGAQ